MIMLSLIHIYLSTAYTPGVAEPCRKIKENPEDVYKYTNKSNTVAVVSDGSAVHGDVYKRQKDSQAA